MKEIQLTEESVRKIEASTGCVIAEPTLLLPPKSKTVKLSDLPDGTIIQGTFDISSFYYYASRGQLFTHRYADGDYLYNRIDEAFQCKDLRIIESPKQVWEGGECPVPDGVIVNYCSIGFQGGKIYGETTSLSELLERIGNNLLWYQILRLADGWELVK